jgi:hypothetical protein
MIRTAMSLTARRPQHFLRIILASTLLTFSGPRLLAQTVPREIRSVDAVQGVVAAFQQHPVVIIGEAHWLRQAGDFYKSLVRDPAFQRTVQDIVIEFASQNNQPLLDRYVAGDDVPIEDVRHIWRDTTKVASWESPIYAEWLAAIREVNKKLPLERRLRVLAGDTPIDWSQIHTHFDWAALGDNNASIAQVVLDQVLQKKHRALVVLGSNHVTKSGGRDRADNATTRIESRHPGSTYVVLLDSVGTLDPATQRLLRLSVRNGPMLYELAGSFLEKTAGQNGSPLLRSADALLYLGPPDGLTLVLPPKASLESVYLKEVDRRSMIEWGELRMRKFLRSAAQ